MYIYVHGSVTSYTKTAWDLLARRAPSPEKERDVTLSECATFLSNPAPVYVYVDVFPAEHSFDTCVDRLGR